MISLAAVFLATFVLLNVMLHTIVIRRVTRLAAHRRPGEPGQPRGRRIQDAQQGRDRRADRGARPHEDQPRPGAEDAGGMIAVAGRASSADPLHESPDD